MKLTCYNFESLIGNFQHRAQISNNKNYINLTAMCEFVDKTYDRKEVNISFISRKERTSHDQ